VEVIRISPLPLFAAPVIVLLVLLKVWALAWAW
jgi:hypothetical protein